MTRVDKANAGKIQLLPNVLDNVDYLMSYVTVSNGAYFNNLAGGSLQMINETASQVFLAAMLLPFLAAGTRRLRDAGKNVWWEFFILVPVGGLVLLGFYWAQPSQAQPEQL